MKDNIKTEHPSYGMLDISRITTTPKMPLFGSSILHGELIALRIKHASVNRHLYRNWYHGGDEIVEVYMSYSQFTKAIMSMNTEGTPVTIKHINHERIEPEKELQNTKELFSKEFQKSLNKTLENSNILLNQTRELINSKTPLNKSQKQEFLSLVSRIQINISSNLAFIVKSFEEQIDQTVTEATGEIEAFFDNKINSLGIDALKQEILQLPNIEET